MTKDLKQQTIRNTILFITILVNAIVLKNGFIATSKWYWTLLLTVPLLLIAMLQKMGEKRKVQKRSAL